MENYYLIEFEAVNKITERYKKYTRLVKCSKSYESACEIIKKLKGQTWEEGTPMYFKNLTVNE